jgi:hypothetical protein
MHKISYDITSSIRLPQHSLKTISGIQCPLWFFKLRFGDDSPEGGKYMPKHLILCICWKNWSVKLKMHGTEQCKTHTRNSSPSSYHLFPVLKQTLLIYKCMEWLQSENSCKMAGNNTEHRCLLKKEQKSLTQNARPQLCKRTKWKSVGISWW